MSEIVEDVFGRYSACYDLLYGDKDYAAEADYIGRRLRAAAPGATQVLELGSGTGKHGRLLAQQGFDVLGVERSDAMVAVACRTPAPEVQTAHGSFECVAGDIRTARLTRMFDVVVALFHVISYQT